MHVLFVADELSIPRVLIPPMPGDLSAFGQMLADHRRDFVSVWGGRLRSLEIDELKRLMNELQIRASNQLEADGFELNVQRFHFSADIRFVGQSYTIAVPIPAQMQDWSKLGDAFRDRHSETFGYADPEGAIEIIAVRLSATGMVDKPRVAFKVGGEGQALLSADSLGLTENGARPQYTIVQHSKHISYWMVPPLLKKRDAQRLCRETGALKCSPQAPSIVVLGHI